MKTIIIGNAGSGAYVFFRYLIFKEQRNNCIVVDDIGNEEFISLQLKNKNNFKTLFYKFDENFKGINYEDIEKYKADKLFINACNEFNIDYKWLLKNNDDVLRISINDLTSEFMEKLGNFESFDKIFIFNPCNEFNKKYLADTFSLYCNHILSFSNGKDEFIEISKEKIEKHSLYELDRNFKLGIKKFIKD